MTTWRYDNGDTLAISTRKDAVRLEVRLHQGGYVFLESNVAVAVQIRDELTRAIDYARGPAAPAQKPEIPER